MTVVACFEVPAYAGTTVVGVRVSGCGFRDCVGVMVVAFGEVPAYAGTTVVVRVSGCGFRVAWG